MPKRDKKQDKKDKLRRQRSLRRTRAEIDAAIAASTGDGIKRILSISDEEWQAAVDADEDNE